MAQARRRLTPGKIVGRIFIVIFTTLIMLVIALYFIMLVIAKGPSENAKQRFVCTVQETSALKFLATWYFTDEEIQNYLGANRDTIPVEETNTALINIAQKPGENGEAAQDGAEVHPATELVDVSGKSFKGKLLKISDPSRVIVGVSGPYGEGCEGKRVKDIIADYGAMAGTNAGGFLDLNGVGNGGTPLGIVISENQPKALVDSTTYPNVVGFDQNNILHVGTMTGAQAKELGLRDAISWELGPVLVVNGKPANENAPLGGGYNPRTAIGQTADGTVLLLVVDGRQMSSIGATYDDLVQVMMENGAINAANLDGGSSSVMYMNGELKNICSSLYGPRPVPTCWLVKPES